jgi:predicted nucleotide-binding protein (sugar kinase/HSP70/actin superfamily)
MGNLAIALSGAIRVLGGEVVVPPYTSKRTLSIGAKYSPEAICLPYKLVLGNYIEAVEAGAEAILMIDSPGTCRLGQYSNIARTALTDLGYNVEFINFDLYNGKLFEIYSGFKYATGNGNPLDLINAVRVGALKLKVTDKFDKLLNYYRPRETEIGSADKRHKKAMALVDQALTVKECNEALKFGIDTISGVETDLQKQVLHVDITGEIYVVLDRFSNMEIEKELGKLGVQVHRQIYLSDWFDRSIYPSIFRFSETHDEKTHRYAREFIKRDIGGDAVESIGDASIAGSSNTDGIIHLLPFTCMPEIIAQNILPNVRNEKDIPILSLVMDEYTGKAGFVTRLEAFVDLIKRRKDSKRLLAV